MVRNFNVKFDNFRIMSNLYGNLVLIVAIIPHNCKAIINDDNKVNHGHPIDTQWTPIQVQTYKTDRKPLLCPSSLIPILPGSQSPAVLLTHGGLDCAGLKVDAGIEAGTDMQAGHGYESRVWTWRLAWAWKPAQVLRLNRGVGAVHGHGAWVCRRAWALGTEGTNWDMGHQCVTQEGSTYREMDVDINLEVGADVCDGALWPKAYGLTYLKRISALPASASHVVTVDEDVVWASEDKNNTLVQLEIAVIAEESFEKK
ncbi:hypothetical protein FIBSPDRAFT_895525 [Athelia psychrophila]|uniref:Uncharacterized protein n=1 Tax=Athelia psychrophila TaxID=1759441 RepID=A0A166EKZ8_9AGAM|nr:hypothetical protein FIBSPDRAFT_895525 [Fibularhizoctonia sp. CBS 109695]